jgi:hypothetical protein
MMGTEIVGYFTDRHHTEEVVLSFGCKYCIRRGSLKRIRLTNAAAYRDEHGNLYLEATCLLCGRRQQLPGTILL